MKHRRYWHRSLNPKKLINVQFASLTKNMTMQRTIKLYKLPEVQIASCVRKAVPKCLPFLPNACICTLSAKSEEHYIMANKIFHY